MVSLASCGDMEPEAGDPEETTLETEMFVKSIEAKSEETGLQSWEEPIMELQKMNITEKEVEKEITEDKKDAEGREERDETETKEAEESEEEFAESFTDAKASTSYPTNEPITSNTHIGPPKSNESYMEDRGKLSKTPSFGKMVRFKEIEAVEERDTSDDTLFPDFDMEEWTTSSFEELFLADDWKDITGEMFM